MLITTPQYNRPQYTKRMLEALSKVNGIEDCRIIASVDRDENGNVNEEIVSLLKDIEFCPVSINISKERLTCNLNTLRTMYLGFDSIDRYADEDVICHIEDDICVAPDCLDMFYNIEERVDIENQYFSVSFFNRLEEKDVNSEYWTILNRPHFVPWGFVLGKKIFREVLFSNCFCPDASHYLSWDLRFNQLREKLNLTEIFPKLSRAINIGDRGTHMWPEHWENNVKLDFWAGSVLPESREFSIQLR